MRVQPGPEPEFEVTADPTLVQVIAAWDSAGYFAYVVDDCWRVVHKTAELASVVDYLDVGEFVFGEAQVDVQMAGRAGANAAEDIRENFQCFGPMVLSSFPGGRDALRAAVHPILRDVVDEIEASDADALASEMPTTAFGNRIHTTTVYQRVRNASGRTIGALATIKPAVGMSTLFLLAAPGDLGHFERMNRAAAAGRRPAAVLFADLEGSAPLAKRLSTANYFRLIRHLTRAADQCIVDAGGLVGRHAGDGVTAFFGVETTGSESAAARACIDAARALRLATREVAARHNLPADEITVRAGMHWGATLYIGSIITRGRTEVTALGDEVNEAARIEACAAGGRMLASKDLIERLDLDDAAALGIDPNHITYSQLADLDTATEKARRDAPAIPVCDIATPAS